MSRRHRAETRSKTAAAQDSRDGRDAMHVRAVCIFLALATLFVFRQTGGFEFINYDDETNVARNPVVTRGLTAGGIAWAFTHSQIGHWVPVTTLSHMLAWQIFGPNAGGHHLLNVVLHAVSAILLFLLLRKMTGDLWPSAFVAAIFAIHPLRVESVAWVTERKDVLSGLFFMLTIGAYVRHATGPFSMRRYLAVVLLFMLGLMSKSMLVTLPFVLLLLDFWPLKRISLTATGDSAGFSRVIWEKAPFLVLSAAVSALTLFTARHGLQSVEHVPMSLRLGNALCSYAIYLGQLFVPTGLAVFYPYPRDGFPAWQIAGSAGLLVAISAAAVALRKEQPWILTGWLWFLGMLVPVIGLVQSGDLARADRYTYLPQIGLCAALAWSAAEWCRSSPLRLRIAGALAGSSVILFAVSAKRQAATWEDSESVWKKALADTTGNSVAHHNLGVILAGQHRNDEAAAHFEAALAINPRYQTAFLNLGYVFAQAGRIEEAIGWFRKALQIWPDDVALNKSLGNILLREKRFDEAIEPYRIALKRAPDSPEIRHNLGLALDDAGRSREAITHLKRALELDPASATAHSNLAWILATSPDASARDGPQALELARRAIDLTSGGEPLMFARLAAAYAETGRFAEALEAGRRAIELAIAQEQPSLADEFRMQLRSYQSRQPFRTTPGGREKRGP